MPNYKKDKMLLLKALRDLLVENIGYESLNPHDEEGIANLILELSDKRRIREMKRILKEYDVHLKAVYAEEKLKEQETMYDREQLRQRNEHLKLYAD